MLSVEFDVFSGFNFYGVISDGDSRCGLRVGYKQERQKKTFQDKLLTPSFKSTTTSSTFKSLGSAQCMLSEISLPNGEGKTMLSTLTFQKYQINVRRHMWSWELVPPQN